ncbi:sucrose transport protein SUC1-like [Arachis stenosperma]|uniref:sucrose transport protein SUC1-like n=1 Tax=Arachis stenosperma TaxID=217475 RepID=UPI0025AC0BB7|nr:sucrose transport protein SUC1-like [Arachis stenosperma]
MLEFEIPDKWTSLVWLVGAVSGSVFHPLLSYCSNTCKFGWRHCPFMFAGAVGATIAFLTIGFAKDIGYAFGDNLSEYTEHRALIIFGIGLWMLKISIKMIDARCREFLDDLASRD